MAEAEYESDFELTKADPYLAHGRAICCDDFKKNLPRYKHAALLMKPSDHVVFVMVIMLHV